MNALLWVLQILAALLYASSGVMKVFLFDKIRKDVPSFGALPGPLWTALGILELVGTIAITLPGVFTPTRTSPSSLRSYSAPRALSSSGFT